MSTLVEDLPFWLKALEMSPDPEWHSKRRAGIETLARTLTISDIEGLIRLAFRTKQIPPQDLVVKLRQAFKAADETFPSSGNDRELQILSGAVFGELFRKNGDVAAVAALAVSTATSLGANRPELPRNLSEGSEEAIQRLSEVNRRRPDLSKASTVAFPRSEFDKATTKFQAQPDVNTISSVITALIDGSKNAFDALQQRISTSLADANRAIRVQDEELNMLWWLIGERSSDLDRSFARLSREQRPAVLAKELAGLTVYLPGPVAIQSLLIRGGVKESDKLSVSACVNACDSEWLRELIDQKEPSPVTQPFHLAIKRKLETGENVAWVAGWAAATTIDAERKFSAVQLGIQIYRERLLSKWNAI